jgi:hypothetical protein
MRWDRAGSGDPAYRKSVGSGRLQAAAVHAACRCLCPGPLPDCEHTEANVVGPEARVVVVGAKS